MEYELINPSDPYTFIASSQEAAALCVFLLSTAYGATPKEGEDGVPAFILGGAEDWYKEAFGRDVNSGINALWRDVASALDSFMLGHFEDRRRYDAAPDAITEPEKRAKFVAEWQDGCSSMNNIGGVAHKTATAIRSHHSGVNAP